MQKDHKVKNYVHFCAGSGLKEDLTVAACMGANHSLRINVQRRDEKRKPETLGSVFLGSVNQRLKLKASGCLQSLTAAEVLLIASKHPKL